MWRVIIVDDEEYVRTELVELFPWEQYGFELIGEVENVKTAINLIKKTNPDLVITDIRMPEQDGLELISWLVQYAPGIVVAVISAYNDFSYVREALRLGASDYLIKAEATPETTGAFLQRVSRILTERRSISNRQKELVDSMAHYRLLAVKSFWKDLLNGSIERKEVKNRAAQLGTNLKGRWYSLIFVTSVA